MMALVKFSLPACQPDNAIFGFSRARIDTPVAGGHFSLSHQDEAL